MTNKAVSVIAEIAGKRWRIGERAHDISIPLVFDAPQPTFFGAARASQSPLAGGTFVGDVRRGGSCNCSTYTITPHCNGTHTECVGHVTQERVSIRDAATDHLDAALLVSVEPTAATATDEASDPPPRAGDRLITRSSLQQAAGLHDLTHYQALVVRTLPNDASKLDRNYDAGEPAPYFSAQAMRWIVDHGVHTLIVDLPSIDRADDAGLLTTHRMFWGLPPGSTSAVAAARPRATVTELAYIDNSVVDGPYLLNLQVPPLVTDAAPSRPILWSLHEP
jgi:arylformamidase